MDNNKEKYLNEVRGLVRDILKEEENIQEGGHSDKMLKKALKYIQRYLDCTVEEVKSGYRICPPKKYTNECYTMHRGDKGIYDLYRFLAKAFGVSKQKMEQAITSGKRISI